MKSLPERIAFEMWNETNPAHLRESITVDNLGEIITPMGDGWTCRVSLALDWRLNGKTFLERAEWALAALEHRDQREFERSMVDTISPEEEDALLEGAGFKKI